jgi:hypothetical protein
VRVCIKVELLVPQQGQAVSGVSWGSVEMLRDELPECFASGVVPVGCHRQGSDVRLTTRLPVWYDIHNLLVVNSQCRQDKKPRRWKVRRTQKKIVLSDGA